MVVCVQDIAVQDCIDDTTGIFDGDTFAGAVPSGVYQVCFCSALLHLLNQLFCVLGRMQLQECLAEASGEGRGRLGDSTLGSCKLCSETGQEVVLSLLRSQNGYRRKYAECICGQEDYVLSCRCGRDRAHDVLDVVDRVRYTGILGYALVSEIDLAVLRPELRSPAERFS